MVVFFYGLVFGSFSNVLIDRLERGESVLWGRSHCDYCKKTLRWYELIPIISYILQSGKCRRCHKSLSIQYPLIELVTGFGYVLLYQYIPMGLPYFFAASIFSSCLVMLLADYKYHILPDEMMLLGSVSAFFYILLTVSPVLMMSHIVSAFCSMGGFYVLWYATKGKGMGFGDVKLAGMMGLLLGYPSIVFAHYIAFLTGATVGVILILTKNKTLKSKIAFGPFLLFGLLLAIVYNQQLQAFWNTYF